MKRNRGRRWFYALGQRAKASGVPFERAPFYAHRNIMPTHAWYAYTDGFHGAPFDYTKRMYSGRWARYYGSARRRMVHNGPNFQQFPKANRPAWMPQTPSEWVTLHHVINAEFGKEPQDYQKRFMDTVLGKPYEEKP